MIEGLVSVIVPVFNRSRMLRQAIESVLGQDYRPLEILIIDDASTDDTPDVIRELERKHPEVRAFLRKVNKGPGSSREIGRQSAKGEFLQYLDSDDLLLPRKLAMQVSCFERRPSLGIVYGFTRYISASGNRIECTWKPTVEEFRLDRMFPSFLLDRLWETSAPLYRAALCERAGGWSDLRLEEDWEYDCRIAALDPEIGSVDDEVIEHRDHVHGRLSKEQDHLSAKLHQRARAHEMIYRSARRAAIGPERPEMQHFARELFHLARQCGVAGLLAHSRRLFDLAEHASGQEKPHLDFRLYRFLGGVLGWGNTARLAKLRERI